MKCISCSSNKLIPCIDLGSIPLVNNFKSKPELKKYSLKMGVCQKCKLLQIIKNIDPKKMFSNYAHISSGSKSNLKHLDNFKTFVEKNFKVNHETKILEIGSNDGSLIKLFEKKTKNIVGVDPAKNLRKKINTKYSYVLSDFFNYKNCKKLKSKFGEFDLIFALNVIPHTNNLDEIILSISKLLSKDGSFIFEGAYFFETIYKGKFDTIYHEHVSSFTAQSLSNVVKKHGLVIDKIQKINTQGGSIRAIIKRKSSSRQPINFIRKEIEKGVNKISTYKKTGLFIEKSIKNIEHKINLISDKKLVLLGAPARGVVIMNVCKLNKNNILFAIDDSTTKHNKFFPGYKFKVFNWDKIYQNDVNFILLSWNYEKDMLTKLKKNLRTQTSKIFIPLPMPGKIKKI